MPKLSPPPAAPVRVDPLLGGSDLTYCDFREAVRWPGPSAGGSFGSVSRASKQYAGCRLTAWPWGVEVVEVRVEDEREVPVRRVLVGWGNVKSAG